MGILSWIVMGLLVGIVAKFIMPGGDSGGIIITILLGIGGAFVGGYVASFLGIGSFTGFNLGSFRDRHRRRHPHPDSLSSGKKMIVSIRLAPAVRVPRAFSPHAADRPWPGTCDPSGR